MLGLSLVVGQNDTGLSIIILILTIVDLVRYHGVFVTVLDVNHDLSHLTHGVGLLGRIKSYGQLFNNGLVTLLNIDPSEGRISIACAVVAEAIHAAVLLDSTVVICVFSTETTTITGY